MTEETTQQFLARRKKELLAQISALKGQLAPKEAELAQITRFEASQTVASAVPANALASIVNHGPSNPLETAIFGTLGPEKTNALAQAGASVSAALAEVAKSMTLAGPSMSDVMSRVIGNTASLRYAHMTIKQLVIRALLDHFHKGATAAEIREFIRNGYGREIDPSSLRPQMHRLKAEGILVNDAGNDVWDLSEKIRANPVLQNSESN
jgi:hypothetical protein